ncbi:hypothetical protein D3C80_1276820 [compost metagenome]
MISTSLAVILARCACLYSSSGPVVEYSTLYSGFAASNAALISSIALLMFSCFQCKILITFLSPDALLLFVPSFVEALPPLLPPPHAAKLSVSAPVNNKAEIFFTMLIPPNYSHYCRQNAFTTSKLSSKRDLGIVSRKFSWTFYETTDNHIISESFYRKRFRQTHYYIIPSVCKDIL